MKPLNLLAFLLGLLLAFPLLSHAGYQENVTIFYYDGSGAGWCVTWIDDSNPIDLGSNCNAGLGNYYVSGSVRTCISNHWHSVQHGGIGQGVCPTPVEPSTCSDGVLTSGEDGIDCGGECSAECLFFCPAGESILYDSEDIAFCGVTAEPDNVGNCPGDTVDAGGGLCVGGSLQDVTLAATDPQLSATFSLVPFETGAVSYSTVSTPETVVDNGDGTETVTITNTTTNNINNTSTSTSVSVNRLSGSPSGTGFSSSGGSGVGVASGYSGTSDIAGETAIEDNPENYDFSPDFGSDGDFDGSLSAEDLPEKSDLMALYDGMITNIPLFAALDTYQVSTSETQCNMVLGNVWGTSLSIDFCRWESYLITFGSILLLITQAGAILIVVRGWK